VAQLVAALITVHGLLSFLSDMYGLFDPSGKTLWLSVDYRRLTPVDQLVSSDGDQQRARAFYQSSPTHRKLQNLDPTRPGL